MASRCFAVRLAAVIAVVATAAACSGGSDGDMFAGRTTSTDPGPGVGAAATTMLPTEPDLPERPLADADPCSLLSADGQAEFGLSGGNYEQVGMARTCQWSQRQPDRAAYIFSVEIWDDAGLSDLPPDLQVVPLPDIGTHQAVEDRAPMGTACTVLMGVTASSRVGITVSTGGEDMQLSCDLALQMSTLVEPALP
jgi:Protein of unknown function (DUF3558)